MKTTPTPPAPPKLNRRRRAQAGSLPCGSRAVRFALAGLRPMVPLVTVCACLDKKPKDILAHIEAGELRWAFDIRSARSRRREVRVLRQSLFEFAGLCDRVWHPNGDRGEFQELLDQILPPEKTVSITGVPGQLPQAAMRSLDVAQCFSCLGQHVLNLIHENSLRMISLHSGPKASPLVTRASVIEFLKTRRLQ